MAWDRPELADLCSTRHGRPSAMTGMYSALYEWLKVSWPPGGWGACV
jgi:hypothetical protein